MARILVLTDEQDRILLHERVELSQFEDEHHSLQILERLASVLKEASRSDRRRPLYA
jgi:hypothetical protein